jgi:hypothetical protein
MKMIGARTANRNPQSLRLKSDHNDRRLQELSGKDIKDYTTSPPLIIDSTRKAFLPSPRSLDDLGNKKPTIRQPKGASGCKQTKTDARISRLTHVFLSNYYRCTFWSLP